MRGNSAGISINELRKRRGEKHDHLWVAHPDDEALPNDPTDRFGFDRRLLVDRQLLTIAKRGKAEIDQIQRPAELDDGVHDDRLRDQCSETEGDQDALQPNSQGVSQHRCHRCLATKRNPATNHEQHAWTRNHDDDERGERKCKQLCRRNHKNDYISRVRCRTVEIRQNASVQIRVLVRWALLSVACGVASGLTSWVFLIGLDAATETRLGRPSLVWLLPLGAGLSGLAFHHLGGTSSRGNGLIFEHVRDPSADLPLRMGPLVLVGALITHLFGGSAGREGVAVQLASIASDRLAIVAKLSNEERQRLLMCAFAGAFGAAFGVPLAGTVFAIEVQSFRNKPRVRHHAVLPCLFSGLVGHRVVRLLGYDHQPPAKLALALSESLRPLLLLKVVAVGVVFGIVASAFGWAVAALKRVLLTWVSYPPLRQVLGGAALVALSLLLGTEALGISTPLLDDALAGRSVVSWMWLAKWLLTAITVGCSLPGGEVTPLFVIGATLGASLADPLGVSPVVLASVGFVAVFAGAANTPVACTVIAIELLGWSVAPLAAIGCGVAYLVSARSGIYPATRVHEFKLASVWERRRRATRVQSGESGVEPRMRGSSRRA